MGILSWLFPSDADRLATARALIAKGRFEDARRGLVHCTSPEAEALYEQCTEAIDQEDAVRTKKVARAAGFRGWRVEVASKERRRELEAFLLKELARSGLDLESPALDEDAVKAALLRAQQKAVNKGFRGAGSVKLVPVMAPERT
jgi:hypothetical protein